MSGPRRETRSVRCPHRLCGLAVLAVAACSGGSGAPPVDAANPDAPAGEQAARFVGLWAVEQPNHALYEVTYYRFDADGAVTIGPSDPSDCSGHLERHCVTGSVARCLPTPPEQSCRGTPTCVFGDRWHSDRVLVIAGVCDDHLARDIAVELAADPTHDADWGGAGGTVLTVGDDPAWAHDNWDWAFRKCPAGTTPANCHP